MRVSSQNSEKAIFNVKELCIIFVLISQVTARKLAMASGLFILLLPLVYHPATAFLPVVATGEGVTEDLHVQNLALPLRALCRV